jgi:hypothetical protein
MQVEEGVCGGAVLYHAHISRSKAEVSAQQAAKDEAAKLKAARRRQQEDNVRRKEVRSRCRQGGGLLGLNLGWCGGQASRQTCRQADGQVGSWADSLLGFMLWQLVGGCLHTCAN